MFQAMRVKVSHMLLLSFLYWGALVWGYFYGKQAAILTSDLQNDTIKMIFITYGYLLGIALALVWFLMTSLLVLIKNFLLLGNIPPLNAVLWGISSWLFVNFGYHLLFLEKRYTELARAIIDFYGPPIYYISMGMVVIFVSLTIWGCFPKKSETLKK